MHWLQLDALVISVVCLASVALLAIVIFIIALACHVWKRRQRTGLTSSTKELVSTSTSDSLQSDKYIKSEGLSAKLEDLLDVEEGLPNFITEDLSPPRTATAGVGSLRQVSLSIFHDLLLSLTNVRLKMTTSNKASMNGKQIKALPMNVTANNPCRPFNMKPSLSSTAHLRDQESILEDLLQHNVKKADETSVETPAPAISTCRDIRCSLDRELPMSEEEMTDALRSNVTKQLDYIFADDCRRHETFRSIMEAMVSAPTAQLLTDAIYRMFRVNHAVIQQWNVDGGSLMGVDPVDAEGDAKLKVDFLSNNTTILWNGNSYGSDLLHSVSKLAQNLRDERRQPTYSEFVAIHLAHYKLNRGCQLSDLPFKPIGSPGFSPHRQTYVNLTDSGKGHVVGTTRFKEWMEGTVVNVERPETGSMLTADMIDFRVPPLLNFAQVRIHVGSSAPATFFIGKAMKAEFEEQFEKDVHMAACAATTAFNYGAAECKICVCGLTSSQAFRYMVSLKAKVNRQPSQLMSAAWNLNRSIIDDHQRPEPRELTTRKDVAEAALEITSLAGFDTVTLCGATTASNCRDVVSQLGFVQAISFNHVAHMRGLVTHFSCGTKPEQIKKAVLTGVDRIGTEAQVLRYMDEDSGTEEDISKILQTRGEASESVRGRGVHILARLDTMFFEGSISEKQNDIRLKLFQALKAACEKDIKAFLKVLPEVDCLPDDSVYPLSGTARRLTSSHAPVLRDMSESTSEWEHFVKCLRRTLESSDYEGLTEEYRSEPWCSYRERYRKQMGIKTGRD